MRNVIFIIALVIAGLVFLNVFAYATYNDIAQKLCLDNNSSYINYLAALGNLGVFCATLCATLYAIKQYNDHKKEHRIKLLGEYNQRYSSDRNIEKVTKWMLKVAIVDNNGEITGANPDRDYCKPGIYEKEMFMRFFEELYLHIKEGHIDKMNAFRLFAYYAILFDRHKNFRLDITDYKSKDELSNSNLDEENKKKFELLWSGYRDFVEKMIEISKEMDIEQ